jgi:hypothetical protein
MLRRHFAGTVGELPGRIGEDGGEFLARKGCGEVGRRVRHGRRFNHFAGFGHIGIVAQGPSRRQAGNLQFGRLIKG